ncbi:MAG TPA: tripartite tricarboxylate transporter substrate-binding protein [Xanthobacteraceae bacterium]|jgi:tripartite-type tricarboxylate transporter receptor subunit TctC|nr:tripartite tricarboxylate transporter substrate-binding protein [Xanthobacteraceae bacterium]
MSARRHSLFAITFAAGLGIFAAGLCAPAHAADPVEAFYKNKTINIYVGFAPGGSYDFYPRLYAQYLSKYIPGHPNIVVQTMTGASSLKAANYIYNVAPKDGTALGVVTQTLMLEDLFKTQGVHYKAAEFNYIGRMTAVLETIIASGKAKAKTIYDVRKYETATGGTGPTSPTEGFPRLLNAFAGTKFKIVSGYPGSTNAMLALESGELDSFETSYSTLVRTKKAELADGRMNILVQGALERTKELPNVPTVVEMGQNDQDRAALALYTSSAAVSRPLIGTPGIPPDRLKALRAAFMATTRDPQFLADIARTRSEFTPESGEFLQALAEKVAATPPDIVARTVAALHAK